MAKVKSKDIATSLKVIGKWVDAVVREMKREPRQRTAMKRVHNKKANPGYQINPDSVIANQISTTGAGIGKNC